MPGISLFPTQDALLVTWANTFASVLSASPLVYGATPAIASAFSTLATNLETAYLTATTPATRTKGTVAAKNQAKDLMKESARKIVRVIYAQTLTDQQLIDIGLRPHDPIPTPVEPITAMPELKVVTVQGRNIRVSVRDASHAVRGRPANADGCILYSFAGATPPEGTEGWTCEGPITKDSIIVAFPPSVDVGAKVYFTAQWFNTRGTGPGCTAVPAVIGAEGALAA